MARRGSAVTHPVFAVHEMRAMLQQQVDTLCIPTGRTAMRCSLPSLLMHSRVPHSIAACIRRVALAGQLLQSVLMFPWPRQHRV